MVAAGANQIHMAATGNLNNQSSRDEFRSGVPTISLSSM
jgi:hypothetical protein